MQKLWSIAYLFPVILYSSVVSQEDDCGQKMPASCKVYSAEDCYQRYEELNSVPDDSTMWAQHVEHLHMQPFTTIIQNTATVSLAISWTLPPNWRHTVKGMKMTVTALDDALQYTVCRLLDFTSIVTPPPLHSSSERTMTYDLTLPSLKDNYNWLLTVESLPSDFFTNNWNNSVVSTFFTTDHLDTSMLLEPGCPMVTVAYTRGPDYVSVTVSGGDMTSRTYDVILYRCEACCQQDCRMEKVMESSVNQTSSTVDFTDIQVGQYNVWIQPAGNADAICAMIGVLTFTRLDTPASPTSVSTTAHAERPGTGKPGTDFSHLTTSSANSSRIKNTVASDDNNDDESRRMVVAVIAGCASVVVVLVVVAIVVCYCRRRRGQTDSIIGDLPCMKKMIMSSGKRPSAAARAGQSGPGYSLNASVIPAHPPTPRIPVCLLGHSTLQSQIRVTDSFALYLQTFCACDVAYFRWQMDNVRSVGPERWTVEQLDKADCVIFVHSLDTRDCYDAWRLGLLKERDHGFEVKMLVAAFGHLSGDTTCRWFDVTFSKDLSGLSDDSLSFLLSGRNWQRSCTLSDDNAETKRAAMAEAESACGNGATGSKRSSLQCFYVLMNDFTRFLADLHNLPNIPGVLRGHNLPIDSEHLDSKEGRQLYKEVASLNCGLQDRSHMENIAVTVNGNTNGVLRMDSGFEDTNMSFFPPEDLSVIDSEATSLGDRFRAINARYEMTMIEEQMLSCSECYSLGGQFV